MPPPRVPRATAAVLTVTAICSILQFPYPPLLAALRRDPAALADGQWWRLVTPLGVLAERLLGTRRWLAGGVLALAATRPVRRRRWSPPRCSRAPSPSSGRSRSCSPG